MLKTRDARVNTRYARVAPPLKIGGANYITLYSLPFTLNTTLYSFSPPFLWTLYKKWLSLRRHRKWGQLRLNLILKKNFCSSM